MALVVIGTERKPNKSDLRARNLTGLPDPGPEVAALRAKLESEQTELRALVGCYEIGVPESSVRMDVDVVEVNGDVGRPDREESLGTRSEEHALQKDEMSVRVEEKELGSGDDVEKSTVLAASVADGPCEPQKIVRVLRTRHPIQIQPYALERKEYRQSLKAGRL